MLLDIYQLWNPLDISNFVFLEIELFNLQIELTLDNPIHKLFISLVVWSFIS